MRRLVLYDARSPAVAAAARRLRGGFTVRPLAGPPRAGAVVLADGAQPPPIHATDVRVVALVGARTAGPWPGAWHVVLPATASRAVVARAVAQAFAELEASRAHARLERELAGLNAIGLRLSSERDPAALLDTILSATRAMTDSDAGSLYLVDEDDAGGRRLHFALAQNDSVPITFRAATLPLTGESVAGHVALSGQTVNLRDAYVPPPASPFRINRWFDDHVHYRTKSMLVVPMRTPQGETLGALQLINCKAGWIGRLDTPGAVQRHVRPYSARHERIAASLASQAAVALHNGRLYEAIQRLFEGFVAASVTAIEARDPTTFGHSFRVADLTVGLADVVDQCARGAYAQTRFTVDEVRELRYAALLHDFGKVGVRERVLVKGKKLDPADLDRIRHRAALLERDLELHAARAKLDHALRHGAEGYAALAARLDAELAAALAELGQHLDVVVLANEPAVLPRDFATELMRISARQWPDARGVPSPLLTPDEAAVLAIPRGSLTEAERRDIEQHVVHTYQFLVQIPWTTALKRVPEIAGSHHEKLDGSGYPHGVRGDAIPLGSRMMTIADIFDALTATDRPYKKALGPDEALDVLTAERRVGAIDADLLDLFIDAKVWERGGARPRG